MSRKSEREAAERAAKLAKKVDGGYFRKGRDGGREYVHGYGDLEGKAPPTVSRNPFRNIADGVKTFRSGR